RSRSADGRGSRRAPSGAPSRGRASCQRAGAARRSLALRPVHGAPAEREAVLLQGLLDLLNRLLAELRDRRQLGLRLHHEVADRLDADQVDAVVRADPELELLDWA